jgi:hypothetical protein
MYTYLDPPYAGTASVRAVPRRTRRTIARMPSLTLHARYGVLRQGASRTAPPSPPPPPPTSPQEGLFGPEGAAECRFSALFGEFHGEFGKIRQNSETRGRSLLLATYCRVGRNGTRCSRAPLYANHARVCDKSSRGGEDNYLNLNSFNSVFNT